MEYQYYFYIFKTFIGPTNKTHKKIRGPFGGLREREARGGPQTPLYPSDATE